MKYLLPLLLFVNGDMPPPDTPPPGMQHFKYNAPCVEGICLVPEPIALAMQENNTRLRADLAVAREELEKLRSIKGCAKLEVLPKLKKDRDT